MPFLRLGPPPLKLIASFEDCPGESSVPLDVFKNLQILETEDVDPRTFLGWDRLSSQLRSLSCRRCGVEDVEELLTETVLLDVQRRKGERVKPRERLVHSPAPPAAKQQQQQQQQHSTTLRSDSPPPAPLPSLAWHFLRHLCLADNNLTFFPSRPLHHLAGLTSLDLSSNLLNAVPPSLSHLPRLASLNVSRNMIDSVLGIPQALGAVRVLNLAHNRLESLCGLERLSTLRRLDLRSNNVWEAAEVGRLAPLQFIEEVWVADNPLMDETDDARVDVLVEFAREGHLVDHFKLDGQLPGYFEKLRVAERAPTASTAARARAGREGTPAADEPAASSSSSSGRTATGSSARPAATAAAAALPPDADVAPSPPVVAVRHRTKEPSTASVMAGSRASRLGRAAASSSAAAGSSIGRTSSPAGEAGMSAIRDTPGSAAAGKRRARRVVDLADEEPSTLSLLKPPPEVSESEAVKNAARAGKIDVALGEADLKPSERPSAALAAASAQPRSTLRAGAAAAAGLSTPPPRQRPSSMVLAPGSSTLSRKAGALAALVTAASDESEAPQATSPSPLTKSGSATSLAGAAKTTAVRPSPQRQVSGGSSTLGRRAGAHVRLRSDESASASPLRLSPSKATAPALAALGEPLKPSAEAELGEAQGAAARVRVGRRANAASLAARRSTVTASLYDPSTADLSTRLDSPTRTRFSGAPASRVLPPVAGAGGDHFRRRIEAMRDGMGDEWLRALARGSVYLNEEGEAEDAMQAGAAAPSHKQSQEGP